MLDIVKSRVNGIDVAGLAAVANSVAADSAKGKVEFDVTTRWTGQTRSETMVTGYTLAGERIERAHKIVVDEPSELLGANAAPNPQELLMAALNACLVVGYVAGAATRGIHVDSLEIQTRGSLDMRGFLGLSDEVTPGFASVEYDVRIESDGSQDQLEEIHRVVMETSPNFANFARPIELKGALHAS